MSSIRDQIVQYVVNILNNAPTKPADVKARRYTMARLDFVDDPSQKPIEVHPHKDIPATPKKGQPTLLRTLILRLDSYSAGEPIDAGMDGQLCFITSILGSDASLGGLALDVREGATEWDEEMALNGLGLCKTIFEIDYIHNRSNQEIKP